MKNFYRILLILALALVLTVGAVSLVSWKQTEGVSEKTVEPPQFSLKALFDGTFIPQFEEYYTATFPARQTLMGWNQKLNRFYYYSGASEEDNMLVLDGSTGAEQGGESLGDVEAALNGKTEPDTTPGGDFENRCPFFKTQQNIRTHPFLCKIKKDTLRVIPQNTLTQTTGQHR